MLESLTSNITAIKHSLAGQTLISECIIMSGPRDYIRICSLRSHVSSFSQASQHTYILDTRKVSYLGTLSRAGAWVL